VLRHPFEKQKCGEHGKHIIWRYHENKIGMHPAPSTEAFWESTESSKTPGSKTDIWRAVQSLEDLGLLVEIPHLVENSSLTSEPIHGLSLDGRGEPAERELANAAVSAGLYLFTKDPLRGTIPRGWVTIFRYGTP
jgi:hypothetical protein